MTTGNPDITSATTANVITSSVVSDDCFMYMDGIPSYTGIKHVTESGRKCQHWDAIYPHTPLYSMDSDQMNYCRTPDNDTTLWCDTRDPDENWEYCNVSECQEYGMTTVAMTTIRPATVFTTADTKSDDCFVDSNGILTYNGTTNVTRTGRTCQHWDTTFPHNPKYPMNSDQMNYCRTPDNDTTLWCYTMEQDKDWEYCDVSECHEYGITTVDMTTTKPEINSTTAITSSESTVESGAFLERRGYRCEAIEFKCMSGDQCILASYQWDEEFDCQDRSDEIGCGPP